MYEAEAAPYEWMTRKRSARYVLLHAIAAFNSIMHARELAVG
jgi:hypothetical protein